MLAYRIARRSYINDLSGTGASLSGGRWNSKGMAMVYTSSSVSLAMLEVLVHLPLRLVPPDMCIAEIRVPDELSKIKISISSLPETWKNFPSPDDLKKIGDNWLETMKSSILQVPSAVNPEEYNYLINPHHTDSEKIKVLGIKDFGWDERLILKH